MSCEFEERRRKRGVPVKVKRRVTNVTECQRTSCTDSLPSAHVPLAVNSDKIESFSRVSTYTEK